MPSLAQQIPCSVRLRRTKEKQDKEVPSPATTLQASNARSADVFQVHGFGGSNPERKRASGVSVPASTDGCKIPPGVIVKILVSRMTSIAFVARSGAVAPPVPFGSGQGPHPFRDSIPHAKVAPHNQRKGCSLTAVFAPYLLHQMKGKYINNTKVTKYSTLPFRGRRVISRYWREANIAFVWTSAYAGAQTFAVCGALAHTLFYLNFLITPPFWYSYSLSFSVLCVAE